MSHDSRVDARTGARIRLDGLRELAATLEQTAESRKPAAIAGTIAGVPVTGEMFEVKPGYRAIFERGKPTPVIGMIGLPFFRSRLLVIDYPRLVSVRAPLIGSLSIGPVSRQSPLIVTFDDPTFRLDSLPGTRGLVGNALLTADHAIVLDLRRLRIGFARSADLPPS